MLTRTGVEIRDVTIGDNTRITRTYTGLPLSNVVFEKAWMTVKLRESAPDSDKLFQKEITTSNSPNGQITDADADGGSIAMYFEILATDTVGARVTVPYRYDIKVKRTGEAKAFTLESGKIFFTRGATAATS